MKGNRAAIVSLALFAVMALVATKIGNTIVGDRMVAQENNLAALNKRIEANFKKIDDNFKALSDADKTVAAELSATRARADLAHQRIEYYKDVMLIVAKTCPGRVRLPRLGGDPGE